MMRYSDRLAREEAFTEALRAANDAIGNRQPHAQATDIIKALKRLRDEKPARLARLEPVDYLEKAQTAARAAWKAEPRGLGPKASASATVQTPAGVLSCETWRTRWRSNRTVWSSAYTLDGEPITVREIRDAGLAQRPTTRNRQKKEPTK